MNKKCLYYCSDCNSFFSGESSVLTQRCDNCKSVLFVAHDDYESYSAMSTAEKREFQQEYIHSHFPANADSPRPKSRPAYQPIPESGWVAILHGVGWFVVTACILLGVFAVFSSADLFLGLIVGLLIALVGVLSVSLLMAFCSVAEDLHAVRNQLGQLLHDRR